MIRYHSVPTYRCARTPARPRRSIFFQSPFNIPSPAIRLCLNESLADLSATLAGRQANLVLLGGLLDLLVGLSEDQLDVAGVGHVGVDLCDILARGRRLEQGKKTYTTVSTVSAAAALGSLVNLDALDNKVASVETLGVGVGLSVLEEVDQELGGLDGPAGLGDTELLAWRRKLSVNCSEAQVPHIEFFFSKRQRCPRNRTTSSSHNK